MNFITFRLFLVYINFPPQKVNSYTTSFRHTQAPSFEEMDTPSPIKHRREKQKVKFGLLLTGGVAFAIS